MNGEPTAQPSFDWQFSEDETARSSQTRIGPYQVLAELGAGAMGQVYRVRDGAGRELALKVLASTSSHSSARTRFEREGQLTASLRHPGIVVVHDAGVDAGRPYLVYELAEGSDLEKRLPDLDRDTALKVVHEVALALGYAHAQGVIHRDFKAANVLLDADGRARVADFGLAQAAGLERLTRTGAIVGTPTAMAPEQVTGDRASYGPHTDVWALGLLLYHVLTGHEAFERATSLSELMAAITCAEIRAPSKVDPSVPPALEAVCLKALAKEPANRQADGRAFAADLERALRGEDTARRSERGLGLLAVVGLLGVALAAWLLASTSGSDPGPSESTLQAAPPTDLPSAEAVASREQLKAALSALENLSANGPAELIQSTQELAKSENAEHVLTLRKAIMARTLEALEAQNETAVQPLLTALAQAGRPAGTANESRLTRDVVAFALRKLESNPELSLRVLEELAGTGLQLQDRLLGSNLMSTGLMKASFDMPDSSYWRLLLLAGRLDLCTLNSHFEPTKHMLTREGRPWPDSPQDPWKRYLDLRIRAHSWWDRGRDHKALRDLVLGPDPEIQLGPCHWADSVTSLAMISPPEEALKLFPLAEERDPRNPLVQEAWATVLGGIERDAEAVVHAERAVELFSERFAPNQASWALRGMLLKLVALQGRLDRRPEARRTYGMLRRISEDHAETACQRFPWLSEAEER